MSTSKTTRMDAQGRILIPPHIRKELNLNAGQPFAVSLEGSTITIQPAEERCVTCGGPIQSNSIAIHEQKRICNGCALAIAKALQV